MPVDDALAAVVVESGPHQPCSLVEDALELRIGDLFEPQPRRELSAPERLRFPDVPDPGHEALVEQRVAELAALVLAAQVRDHAGEVERLGEDVRPEAARAALGQLEHRAVPEHGFALGAREHEPGLAVQLGTAVDDLPAAAHAQVAAEHEAALEAQQQVLADRFDPLEPAAVQPVGGEHRGSARVRRLDRQALTDQHLQLARSAVEGVAFGHAGSLGPRLVRAQDTCLHSPTGDIEQEGERRCEAS